MNRYPQADAGLVVLPKPLAGMGTDRQVRQACPNLLEIFEPLGGPVEYVGPAMPPGDDILGCAPAPIETFEDHGDPGEIFARLTAALTAAFTRLAAAGRRRLLCLCMGYTAYGPECIRRAVRTINERNPGAGLYAVVLIIDSAFPDMDGCDETLDACGMPACRFFTPGYCSDESIETHFLLTSSYGYNPEVLEARRPPGLCSVSVVTPPYTEKYVNTLVSLVGDAAARDKTLDNISGLSCRREGDLIAPLVSSDIWNPDAVGKWMTEAEYETVTTGTRGIIEALLVAARESGKRIFVPIDAAGAGFIGPLGINGVTIAQPGCAETAGPVVLCPYSGLPQDDHARMLAAADFAVSRTGAQANASVVLALARTPNVIVDMPALGYMQSVLTSKQSEFAPLPPFGPHCEWEPLDRPRAWFAEWNWGADRIAELFLSIIGNPAAAAQRASNAAGAFLHLFNNPETGFRALLKRFAGMD